MFRSNVIKKYITHLPLSEGENNFTFNIKSLDFDLIEMIEIVKENCTVLLCDGVNGLWACTKFNETNNETELSFMSGHNSSQMFLAVAFNRDNGNVAINVTQLGMKTVKDYVTPQMFGAKGDGVTDDTDAFMEAVSYPFVNLNGKSYLIKPTNNITDVKIENGTIICDKQISIYNGIFKDIVFDGQNNNLKVRSFGNVVIDGCTFRNISNPNGATYAIMVSGSDKCHISNCVFENIHAFDEDATEEQIENGLVRCISIYDSNNIHIHGNRFNDMRGYGDGDIIHILAKSIQSETFPFDGMLDFDNLEDVIIENNTFTQSKCKSCIKIQAGNVVMKNNYFYLNDLSENGRQYAVVRVQGGRNNVFNNNVIKSINKKVSFILYTEYSDGCQFTNNSITIDDVIFNDNSYNGIFGTNHANDVKIKDNIIVYGSFRSLLLINESKKIYFEHNMISCTASALSDVIYSVSGNFNSEHCYIVDNNFNYLNYYYITNDYIHFMFLNRNHFYCDGNGCTIRTYKNAEDVYITKNTFERKGTGTPYYPIDLDTVKRIEIVENKIIGSYSTFIRIYRNYIEKAIIDSNGIENSSLIYIVNEDNFWYPNLKYIKTSHQCPRFDFASSFSNIFNKCVYEDGHIALIYDDNKLIYFRTSNNKWYDFNGNQMV